MNSERVILARPAAGTAVPSLEIADEDLQRERINERNYQEAICGFVCLLELGRQAAGLQQAAGPVQAAWLRQQAAGSRQQAAGLGLG